MSSALTAAARAASLRPVVRHNLTLLRQGIAVLLRVPDEVYSGRVEALPGSTIGAHIRHCLDFYLRLLEGLGEGTIDYDSRRRDRSIEERRSRALEVAVEISRRVEALESRADEPLLVRLEGDEPAHGASSLLRELDFAASHTIHHYALISVLLRLHGVMPLRDFGVSPSTLRARQAP